MIFWTARCEKCHRWNTIFEETGKMWNPGQDGLDQKCACGKKFHNKDWRAYKVKRDKLIHYGRHITLETTRTIQSKRRKP